MSKTTWNVLVFAVSMYKNVAAMRSVDDSSQQLLLRGDRDAARRFNQQRPSSVDG
jgi:hypothetical protein